VTPTTIRLRKTVLSQQDRGRVQGQQRKGAMPATAQV